MVARAYQHSYGLPILVARLFNTYGPGMERFVLLDFLHKLQANPQQLEILGQPEKVAHRSLPRCVSFSGWL